MRETPPAAPPRLSREPASVQTPDGWTLRGEIVSSAAEPPRAVAVALHAMMVDRRTLDRPAGAGLVSTLADRGVAVLWFDLRGHGRSGPTAREGARFLYDDFVRSDIPRLVAEARARFPALPVAVVGHSLGGHAALIAAGRDPDRAPDAVVGIAANLWMRRLEPSFPIRLAKSATMLAWLAVSAPLGRFDPRWLRAGTDAEPWPYVRQLARGQLRDRLEGADGEDYLAALARVRLPVLSIASEGDRLLGRPAGVAAFMRLMPRARLTERLVRRGELGPGAPDHMGLVVRESSRPLWGEIADWLLAQR